jgi:crotonobetainyl-CoA:carnitine CoA-transferase CaiB-like acyl-CoA transferase
MEGAAMEAETTAWPAEGAFRVLEIAGPATAVGGRLLAEAGAAVLKIEPPGGAPERRWPPLVGPPGAQQSAFTLYHDAGKRVVTLDLDAPADRARFAALAATADVLLEGWAPGALAARGLGYEVLAKRNPGLVLVSITPFGQDGPYSQYQANDLVVFAMGGLMFISGEPGQPPVVAPDYQAWVTAGTHAALAALAALWARARTGQGDWIDVSAFECLAAQENTITNYTGPGEFTRRNGSQHRTALPGRVVACRDGYVHLFINSTRTMWERFVAWVGRPEVLADPALAEVNARWRQAPLIQELTERFVRDQPKAALFESGQAHHLPCVPVYSPAEFLADAQTAARTIVTEAIHPTLGRYRTLRPPLALAPPAAAPPPAPAAPARPPDGREETGPLRGVRVCAFTHVAAGPYATLQLAYLGAEVIKVESTTYIDSWRYRDRNNDPERSRPFADHNKNVRSVLLDLKTPEGVALARRLIATCDATLDNFSVGVLDRLGLGFEDLRRVRPDIIVLHMAALGATGPRRDYVTFGPSIMALCGMTHLWNLPDAPEPVGSQSSYPDYLVGCYAAYALVAALHRRARTGEAQLLDLAQVEVMACALGPSFVATLNGAADAVRPRGNAPWPPAPAGAAAPTWLGDPPAWAPYGCYPCRADQPGWTDDDAWCVIAVETDAQWAGLRRAMGDPAWAADPTLATGPGRVARAAWLDAQVAAWTRQHTPRVVMERCQAEGVPAGFVATGEDLVADPHLRARGFLLELTHRRLGPVTMPGIPVRFARQRLKVWRYGPLLGEDNAYVLQDLLGLSAAEVEDYMARGVVR